MTRLQKELNKEHKSMFDDNKLNEYEVTFTGKIPKSHQGEYGVGTNPPLVLYAENTTDVKKKLTLPRGMRIKEIKKIGKFKHW